MAKVFKTSSKPSKNPVFNSSSSGGASKALKNINNIRYNAETPSSVDKFGYGISEDQWRRGKDPYATTDRTSETKPR